MQLQIKHKGNKKRKKESRRKRFEKIKLLHTTFFSGITLYFFLLLFFRKSMYFPLKHFVCSGTRITFWSKSKQGENGSDAFRSPDMTLSNVNMAKNWGMWIYRKVKDLLFRNVYSSENIFLTYLFLGSNIHKEYSSKLK